MSNHPIKPKSEVQSPKSKPTWGTRGRTQYGITCEGFISFWEWNHYQSITSSFFFNRIRAPMGSTAAAAEKSEEELRREIDELLRQQRQVSSFSLSLSLSLSKTLYTSLSLSLSLSLILFFNFKKKKNQITERLRDPRGLRRGGFSGTGPRNLAANGPRQRGFLRPVRIPCLFPQKKKNFGRNLIFDLFIYLGFRLIGLTPMVNLQPNADFRPRLSR